MFRRLVRQMGADGWLGVGWPKEFGGQGRPGDRPVHLLRRGAARRRTVPVRDAQHRRADADELRLRRAEGDSSCRASSAARSTSPSATPSLTPAPTSRRSSTARCATATSTSINGNKVFTSQARPGRLHLAGRAHRSRRTEAPRHLDRVRPDVVGRLQLHTDRDSRRHEDDGDLLRRRARARRQPRR